METTSLHTFSGCHVLVVDDEEAFADALSFRLITHGIQCQCVFRGEDAIARMDDPDLEIVLLDINMPGLHGLEVLSQIKEQRPDVEVLLLTGESNIRTAARGMRRGASDYLLKPVDFSVLLESITKAHARVIAHKERLRMAQMGRLLALGGVATGVAHEINNPLQIIVQAAEYLQELIEEGADQENLPAIKAMTAKITTQALRCGKLTAQLLELSRQQVTHKGVTHVSEVIAKVCNAMQDRLVATGIATKIHIDQALPPLSCSPTELELLISHLVSNALDALDAIDKSRESIKELEFTAFETTQGLTIKISDTGIGIRPEHMMKLFDPFFSTKAMGKGIGLGLTVAHSIVTALQGSIAFYPQLPHGTVCIVTLPKTVISAP